ncbi:hypothetical protein BOW53_16820 [Solemya pervernicosa gill symbiont]|uniref:Uncharacterized protein n=1 Tax=Solemya pervernicosa gill symbiont TaxID=642797 RepID=A0A1T2KYP4_9GAMM|nr:hypothetical protein BOW53_16820 [Solemya pervernicosa gill symbiont]
MPSASSTSFALDFNYEYVDGVGYWGLTVLASVLMAVRERQAIEKQLLLACDMLVLLGLMLGGAQV